MKQKVLLCWDYGRRSWVKQFEEIFEPGSYVFLNFYCKELEKGVCTEEKVYYWNDFENVDALIETLNPSTVIFMGLDSPYTFLLNHVCKKQNIKTFYLQHGIFHSYKAYRYEEESMRKIINAKPKQTSITATAETPPRNNFFVNSFKLNRIALYLRLLQFLAVKKFFNSLQRALKAVGTEIMQADTYIVYTKHLANILQYRDGVKEAKIIETGNTEANELIQSVKALPGYSFTGGDYFLFIDEAFSGSEEFLLPAIITAEEQNNFLLQLSNYAAMQGKRLLVKLHPFSYNSSHFILHDNIEYVKQADFTVLIGNAYGVFGFSSTLLIPALYVKRCCIFRLNMFSDIHKALEEINYCKVLHFHNFKMEDITFNDTLTPQQQQAFVKYFLYKLDNEYSNRLKAILQHN